MRKTYESAAATALPVVKGITPQQLDAPTPCGEYTVRELMNHLFHVVVEFRKGAAGQDMDFSDTPDRITGDWQNAFAVALEDLVEAWSDPAAMEHDNSTVGMPRRTVAHLPVIDLAIHSWDLSRATGQRHEIDPGLAATVLEFTAETAPMGRQYGVFGEEVAVPDGAATLDKALGVAGRDPQWTP